MSDPDRYLTGTAIYVYFTLANWQGPVGPICPTSANFTVDAENPVLYIYERDLSTSIFQSIYEKSSSGIINIRPKKWD